MPASATDRKDDHQAARRAPRADPPKPLPPRPRAVLRLGFAGRRELAPAAEAHLRLALGRILAIMGQRLVALTPGVPAAAERAARVTQCYAPQPPLLRLVTGLCEGADALAAQVLADLAPAGEPPGGLETELAAVLPFDLVDYRDSRPDWFRAEFDAQAQRCTYILTLDGLHAKPGPDTPVAAARRAKAYPAQSALLLRHTDILIAAADPDQPGLAGGTLETVRAALAFELPVVFIHTGTAHTGVGQQGLAVAAAAGHTIPDAPHPRAGSAWLLPVLLTLGVLKLGIVVFISRNTRGANMGAGAIWRWTTAIWPSGYAHSITCRWPGVSSRRPPRRPSMPRASPVRARWTGCSTPLPAVSPRRGSRPWRPCRPMADGAPCACGCCARARPPPWPWCATPGSPARLPITPATPSPCAGSRASPSRPVPCSAAPWSSSWPWTLRWSGCTCYHWLPPDWSHRLHAASPWLLFLAALLPAAVAALNGLRFQSECRRLAERSATLRVILGGRPAAPANPRQITGGRGRQAMDLGQRIAAAHADPATDPGAWSLDTLLLAERIAEDCTREVAEWSVLYAKELPET